MRYLAIALLVGCAHATEPVCTPSGPTCDGDDGALCLLAPVPGDCVGDRVTGAPSCRTGEPVCVTGVPSCVSMDQFDGCN